MVALILAGLDFKAADVLVYDREDATESISSLVSFAYLFRGNPRFFCHTAVLSR